MSDPRGHHLAAPAVDRFSDDKWFAEYQHLERARLEAYELMHESSGDLLHEWSTLAARWRALGDFWVRVRDDPSTPFLLRAAASNSAHHAHERAGYCVGRAHYTSNPTD